MDLHCWAHNTTHPFTPDEVEEIVYALTAWVWDFASSAEGRDVEYFPRRLTCPKEALDWARDGEMYAEHVEQGVECRKAAA